MWGGGGGVADFPRVADLNRARTHGNIGLNN